jgi:hypothetical protein
MKPKETKQPSIIGFAPIAMSMAVITGVFLAFQKLYFNK